jgi:hypothetical protein
LPLHRKSDHGGAGASNAGGTRPPMSSTTTTGSTATQPAAAIAKPNPWYPDHAVFNATKDEMQNMPEFKYSEWSGPQRMGQRDAPGKPGAFFAFASRFPREGLLRRILPVPMRRC